MFICDKCHGDDGHLFKSYGPCEVCGKTAECSDCHCPKPVKVDKNGLPLKDVRE